MSTLLALFRRLLFRRRSTEATKSNESDKVKKRTKSLNISSTNNTNTEAGGSIKRKTINIGRSGSIIIRNRSQTESVTVERKHVHRSTEKNPLYRSATVVRPIHITSIQLTSPSQIAPTLTPSYSSSRIRSTSTSKAPPTTIYIKS